MIAEKPETKTMAEQKASDARIDEVVQLIVTEFKGDPGAFFESIRKKKQPKDSAEQEARVVRRFLKSA
jgi:hypothetical protein